MQTCLFIYIPKHVNFFGVIVKLKILLLSLRSSNTFKSWCLLRNASIVCLALRWFYWSFPSIDYAKSTTINHATQRFEQSNCVTYKRPSSGSCIWAWRVVGWRVQPWQAAAVRAAWWCAAAAWLAAEGAYPLLCACVLGPMCTPTTPWRPETLQFKPAHCK